MRQTLEQAGTAPAPIDHAVRICAVGGEHVHPHAGALRLDLGARAASHRRADALAKPTPPALGTPCHRPRHPEQACLRAQTSAKGQQTIRAESAISNCAGQRSDHAQQLRLVRGQRARSADGSVQRTVEPPSTVTGRCPLSCGDGRRAAPKSPEIGQSPADLSGAGDFVRARVWCAEPGIMWPGGLLSGSRAAAVTGGQDGVSSRECGFESFSFPGTAGPAGCDGGGEAGAWPCCFGPDLPRALVIPVRRRATPGTRR